jgi:Raf kinase inhibitor-like YbhB/YbcL family protein
MTRGSAAACLATAFCIIMSGAGALAVTEPASAGEKAMSFRIESGAFKEGGAIPAKHTCDGPDVSPALRWSGAPEGAKSFALIGDDPDAPAGTWVHWVLYDLPATVTELAEGLPADRELKGGGRQGTNDFRRIGYGGPCPPPGKPHRYYFKLFALDAKPGLDPGATKAQLLEAVKGHVLAETQLMGTYGR